ncbi:MAG: VCBS repeat-containing protein [Bryobacteraceae bacterium]|nr:VCBS repeat-containing protein [Bryobacteraceae bacterium]
MIRGSILASVLVLGTAATGFAQQITSVVNFASLDNQLSPGALAFVRGTGLNIGSPPAVTVTQGVARAAWVSPNDVSATQLLIQIPLDATAGPGMLTVGAASYSINVTPYAPGVFSRDSTGTGIGSFLHVSGGQIVSLTTPAAPNESLIAFAVGLGQTTPPGTTGVPFPGADVPTAATPVVRVGGVPATVTSSVLVAGSVGFYRITFNVPSGLPKGRYDVIVSMGGQESNAVTLPVQGPFTFGDFDQNAISDIVWQHIPSGQAAVWFLGGAQGNALQGVGWLHPGDPVWAIVAVADFDADGRPDLVWRHKTTGQVAVWLMGGSQGTQLASVVWLHAAGDPAWEISGVADFDANGTPDVIWSHKTTGQVAVWLMGGPQGAQRLDVVWLHPTGDPTWGVTGVADFDKNGTPDVIWSHKTTGQVAVWLMGGPQGAQRLGVVWLHPAGDPIWGVAGVTDFDRNGTPDVIWRETNTGQVGVWLMGGPQGTQLQSVIWLHPGPTDWRPISGS